MLHLDSCRWLTQEDVLNNKHFSNQNINVLFPLTILGEKDVYEYV